MDAGNYAGDWVLVSMQLAAINCQHIYSISATRLGLMAYDTSDTHQLEATIHAIIKTHYQERRMSA